MTGKLPALTRLSIHGMQQCELSLHTLACARHLESLSFVGAQVEQLTCFGLCRALVDVSFVHCHDLRSLAPLAGAAPLRFISVVSSDVESLDGLADCPNLEEVRFTECERLSSLAPRAGAPRLQTLSATQCVVRNIDGLCTYPHLESVDFSWCAQLLSPCIAVRVTMPAEHQRSVERRSVDSGTELMRVPREGQLHGAEATTEPHAIGRSSTVESDQCYADRHGNPRRPQEMPAPRERQLDRFAQTDESRTASWCSTIADSQRSRVPSELHRWAWHLS
ncbi:hypothetical protein LBRM_29_2910 [Leishmania braziliensis MHOM/BR/75/M2904]|uniref:Leucine-rich repeat protein n=1 Tax=Leishmania braziliensis TaxID=5660 RepID=A4HHU2_LEIBR|nr:hypothetical protein LBRM_29_2910 [Leishmania braziliensis MHOM/BR/75/M2904]CAJ2466523.1 unnamed protein product [Leishmania braziliensis]CAM40147.1 hypothetical protein LBRM_29_2910 [Leishmania braziliensis MHOM/BR/75/M2904]